MFYLCLSNFRGILPVHSIIYLSSIKVSFIILLVKNHLKTRISYTCFSLGESLYLYVRWNRLRSHKINYKLIYRKFTLIPHNLHVRQTSQSFNNHWRYSVLIRMNCIFSNSLFILYHSVYDELCNESTLDSMTDMLLLQNKRQWITDHMISIVHTQFRIDNIN